jgi:hypothetical protein
MIFLSHIIDTADSLDLSESPSGYIDGGTKGYTDGCTKGYIDGGTKGYIDGGTKKKPGLNPFGHYPHTLKIDFDNEVIFKNSDHFNKMYGKSDSNLNKIDILNIRVVEILVEMIDAIELAVWDSAVD